MSIVERAIGRLRGNSAQPRAQRAFGRVVQEAAAEIRGGPAILIDHEALRSAGMLAPRHQQRRIASQYRHIKRPVIAAALGRGRDPVPNGRLIMMASAMPGEGKTFTAINLALSLAMEKDLQVVLVDADVAKPQISKMFGASGQPGLLDALADDSGVEMEDLILPTDVANMYLLPSGAPRERATELLASDRMAQSMSRLIERNRNRIFVFDSSPLLLTTEATALADIVGQVILVVRAGLTEESTLLEALARLPEGCNASLVLNQSTQKKGAGSYYYYGYGEQDG